MRKTVFMMALAAAVLMTAAATRAQDSTEPQPGVMAAQYDTPLNYYLYLPRQYGNGEAWPLLVFLHGRDQQGTDITRLKKHGPPHMVAKGEDLPFVMLAPQMIKPKHAPLQDLTDLIDKIERTYRIDPSRIYLTGLSLGGSATWNLAAYTPERFAAIVPICGRGDPTTAATIARIPTWVFHGARDGIMKPELSWTMVNAIRAAGGDPRFTLYPERGHLSWKPAYADPELWQWLLAQRRPEGGY